MTRIKLVLFFVVIGSSMYAAAGLLTSLREFGIGAAIAALAVCMQGLVAYLEDRDEAQMRSYREQVWLRREL